jgi:hypothetical protein
MVGLVVAVLVLCMTVRVSFFHFISFHFISFHFISFHFISFHFISFHSSFWRLEDYLKKRCEQSLSIDSAAAFSAVLPENGAYHMEAIFHGPQFSIII